MSNSTFGVRLPAARPAATDCAAAGITSAVEEKNGQDVMSHEPDLSPLVPAAITLWGDKEALVKQFLAAFLLLLAPALSAQQPVPEIPFDGDINFLKLPADLHLGEVSGVAVNSKGTSSSSSAATAPPGRRTARPRRVLLEFGPDGKFIREIGQEPVRVVLCARRTRRQGRQHLGHRQGLGHGRQVQSRGPRRPWSSGARRKRRTRPSAWTRVNPPRPPIDGQFRQPTDVAWDTQGNIFISDGYINSRVAKFDKNGDWVKSWGERGTGPGQFNTPHSIATDAKGNIYVADRGNRRIQVFDPDGNLQREIKIDVPMPPDAKPWFGNQPTAEGAAAQNGAPWAICITPGPTQYLYSSDAFPGRIYKLTLDGKVVGMLGKSGRQPKQFGWIHEIACPSENELYVGELLNWRVQKLTLKPQAGTR